MLSGPSAASAPKKKIRYQGGAARPSVAPTRPTASTISAACAGAGNATTCRPRARGRSRRRRSKLFELRDGDEHDLGDLGAGVLHGALGLDVDRVEGVQPIREQRGIRIHDAERQRGARAIARLLETLAQRRRRRILARIDQAARNLERDALRAVAVLPHEHGLAVGRDRQDLRPVDRSNAMKRARLAVDRRRRDRALDREDAAVRDASRASSSRQARNAGRRQCASRACPAGRSAARRHSRAPSCSSTRTPASANCSSRGESRRASPRIASTTHRTAAGRAPSAT